MELSYKSTNENLEGIITALDVGPSDTVLTVGGSGDQAFALLEFGGSVHAVDPNPAQVAYIQKRARELEQGDYSSFVDDCKPRLVKRTFSASGRLERIRKKLTHLTISHGNIFKVAEQGTYSRVYLSNAVGYVGGGGCLGDTQQILEGVARRMPVGGLIYVADHNGLSKACTRHNDLGFLYGFLGYSFLPKSLVVDTRLSVLARIDYNWSPAVYRRVSTSLQ